MKKGLIGVQMSTIAPAKMPSFDAFDAMTEDRPYRKAITMEEAVDEILRNAGTQFDPTIAKVFTENVLLTEWK